jgi:exopolysaccharide biosynthesis WecB/TagA/CpsF family protein
MFSTFLQLITHSEDELLEKISNSTTQKQSLYLLYSEFCLRAKENPNYLEVLKNANYLGVDGKGIIWVLDTIDRFESDLINNVVNRPVNNIFSFCIVYIGNFISAFNFIFLQRQTQTRSGVNLILGRKLTYSLLDLAQSKKWSTLLVGGGNLDIVKTNIVAKYPELEINALSFESDSAMMKDGLDFNSLTSNNLYVTFPELVRARTKVFEMKPDLILVGLGGTSGKQEILIENLQKDTELNFGLAVGIGAALDHLGGGKKQKEAPAWMQKIGLEFVWRIFNQPYRSRRILESVFGLIQLVSKEMLQHQKKPN